MQGSSTSFVVGIGTSGRTFTVTASASSTANTYQQAVASSVAASRDAVLLALSNYSGNTITVTTTNVDGAYADTTITLTGNWGSDNLDTLATGGGASMSGGTVNITLAN
jgi:phage tail sheath gpL-like